MSDATKPTTVNLRVEVLQDVQPCEVNGESCSICGEMPYLTADSVTIRGMISGSRKPLFVDVMYVCSDCGDELCEAST